MSTPLITNKADIIVSKFVLLHYIVSGDANFHMKRTGLTVGGFTQPSVAKSLVESPQAIERGLVQRFLWIFPKPTYSKFAKLQTANQSFIEYLSKFPRIIILLTEQGT